MLSIKVLAWLALGSCVANLVDAKCKADNCTGQVHGDGDHVNSHMCSTKSQAACSNHQGLKNTIVPPTILPVASSTHALALAQSSSCVVESPRQFDKIVAERLNLIEARLLSQSRAKPYYIRKLVVSGDARRAKIHAKSNLALSKGKRRRVARKNRRHG